MGGSKFLRALMLPLTLAAMLAYVPPASGQERHLTGEIFTGYSGVNLNSFNTDSLYAGFRANLTGYWKHPNVLTYQVQPNVATGFQYAGPLLGPQGRGVSASTTFLGGTRFPLTAYYSRQTIPTPQIFTDAAGETVPGLSRGQQFFGLDWNVNFNRLPTFEVHYQRASSSLEYPEEFGGDTESHDRELRLGSQYEIRGWRLGGAFSKTRSEARNLLLLDDEGRPELDVLAERDLSFSASRPLPKRSLLVLDVGRRRTEIDFANRGSFASYTRGSGSFTSQPTDRLSVNLNTSYLSNFADYSRQQILQPGGGPNLPPGTTLLAIDSALLNYGGGAQYRISKGLSVHGSYYATNFLSGFDTSTGVSGDGYSAGAGLSLYRPLLGGQLNAGYNYTHSVTNNLVDYTSNQQAISAGYSRRLPWGLQFSSFGTFTDNDIHRNYADSIRNYSFHAEVSRHAASGWDFRGRVDFRRQSHFYPVRNKFNHSAFQFVMSSKKLQILLGQRLDRGLAFRFGTGFNPFPNTPDPATLEGLPPLVETAGNGTNVAVTYRPTRRLLVRGGWLRGSRSINGGDAVSQRAMDVHAEYAFRQIRLAAGYARSWNQLMRSGTNDFHTRILYFELKRDFRIF